VLIRGRMISALILLVLLGFATVLALAQVNSPAAEQQRIFQEQERRVQAEQRESIERVQRQIAHAQAEQQRELQERAVRQRRAEIDVARQIETQAVEEQRRALILRQHQAAAEMSRQQTAQYETPRPEPSEPVQANTAPMSSRPKPSPFVFHLIGITLLASALALALGSWIRGRFVERSGV
jgi:TolA-binding protein